MGEKARNSSSARQAFNRENIQHTPTNSRMSATGVIPSLVVVILFLVAVPPALPQPTTAPQNVVENFTEGPTTENVVNGTVQDPVLVFLHTKIINSTEKRFADVTLGECSYKANGQNGSYTITERGRVERNATAEEAEHLDEFFRNNHLQVHDFTAFIRRQMNMIWRRFSLLFNWFSATPSIENQLSSDRPSETSEESSKSDEKIFFDKYRLGQPPCLCATGCDTK